MRVAGTTLLGMLAASGVARAGGDDIRGVWLTNGEKAQVEIASCGAAMCGRVLHVVAGPDGDVARDAHNPDPKLRARAVVGLQVLTGFKPDNEVWTGGRVYDPEEGKSYSGSLELQPDGMLKLTACLSILCQSELWKRVR
jgi:uncharacterized protein (DUF2147 family)